MLPPVINTAFAPTNKIQFFGLDLIDEESERTYWTHKAGVWKTLFKSVQEIAATGKVEDLSEMFHGIDSCPVQAKGSNEPEMFKSGNNKAIQHWIMLVPMPADIDPYEYIPKFLSEFQALCKKSYIRSAYKSGVAGFITHSGLLSHISEDGTYWTDFEGAVQKDIIF